MGVRLTNIQTFREISGRRRTLKFGAFDQLVCTLIGPQATRNQWVPDKGAQHPEYGLMLVTDVNDVEQDGALVTLSVTYVGRMYINGFQPQPKYSISETETSASVQVAASQEVNRGKSQVVGYFVNGRFTSSTAFTTFSFGESVSIIPVFGPVGRVVRYGYATLTCNYVSKSVTAKYQTLSRPNGPAGYNQGASISIISTIIGEVSGVELIYGPNGAPESGPIVIDLGAPDRATLRMPTPLLICTAFTADQVAGSLYDCSETWELKFIDSSHTT